ncbi:hypothetical protein N2152v2_006554 [Parachlorella kessleri]
MIIPRRLVVRDSGVYLCSLSPARPQRFLCSLTAPSPSLRSAAPAAKARGLLGRPYAARAVGSPDLPSPDQVAAYLERHGISAAQVQQEQPHTYAQLTLPLAHLLVAFLGKPSGLMIRSSELGPADLAARLSLPSAFSREIAALRPLLWSMPVETLQSTEASVMQLFSLSDSDWVALPSLFASEVATLSSTLEFVAGLLTLPREEWGLVLSRSSKSLDLSRESLAKHVQALQTYGFYQKGIRNLLVGSTASYMVVSASAERIIIPAMAALEELLGGGDKQAVIELCPRCPGLAVSRPAKLRHNFHVLLGYGLTEEQARQLLLEVPQLYTWDLGGPEMQAKLRYYQEVFGIGPLQMLLNRRGYLREGLAKVDLRVRNQFALMYDNSKEGM